MVLMAFGVINLMEDGFGQFIPTSMFHLVCFFLFSFDVEALLPCYFFSCLYFSSDRRYTAFSFSST